MGIDTLMEGRVETLEEGPRLEFISWKGTEGHDDWWARLMQHEELKRSIFNRKSHRRACGEDALCFLYTCIFSEEDGLWALASFSGFPQGAKIAPEQGMFQQSWGAKWTRRLRVVALVLY